MFGVNISPLPNGGAASSRLYFPEHSGNEPTREVTGVCQLFVRQKGVGIAKGFDDVFGKSGEVNDLKSPCDVTTCR